MTKCPPKHCKPTTSFFYKVLISLKQLQSTEEYCNGASLADIETFMEKTYCLTGDLRSQLENSLCIADQSRLVIKKRKIYSLISPAANLHVIPEPCVKAKLEEIKKSFNSIHCPADEQTTRKSSRIHSSQSSHGKCNLEENPSTGRNRKRRRESKQKSKSRSRSRSLTKKNKELRTRSHDRSRSRSQDRSRSRSQDRSRSRSQDRSRSRSPSRSLSPERRSSCKCPKKESNVKNEKSSKGERDPCKIENSCPGKLGRSRRSSSPFSMPSKSCLKNKKNTNDKKLRGSKKEVVFKREDNSSPCL